MQFSLINLMQYLLLAIVLLFTIVIHELAHGYMALAMGDDTAKRQGRLTLNPIKHIDIAGMICMFLFKFGWAKPVPINPYKFRKRKLGLFLVSIAGVSMNFLIALISGFILSQGLIHNQTVLQLVTLFFLYNVAFGVFNSLPFPPLDGSKIITSFLPISIQDDILRHERILYLILIALIFTRAIDYILWPLIDWVMMLILNLFA